MTTADSRSGSRKGVLKGGNNTNGNGSTNADKEEIVLDPTKIASFLATKRGGS